MKLANVLLEMDLDKFKTQEQELEKEIDSKFGGDPFVRMGEYAGGRSNDDPRKDRGFGSVTFRIKTEFEDQDWKNLLLFIKSKGLDVTQESNYYDIEPGEREWFPTVKFDFDIKES